MTRQQRRRKEQLRFLERGKRMAAASPEQYREYLAFIAEAARR